MPARVHLVCWDEEACAARAARLRALGYSVETKRIESIRDIRALRDDPPAAVIIDLDRIPSRGRDVAIAIRRQKPTRQVPLIFVGGDAEKVARVQALLPDAIFTSWRAIRASLRRALTGSLAQRALPSSAFAPYAGTALSKKLGLRPGVSLWLIDPPPAFSAALGPLPAGAVVQRFTLTRLLRRLPTLRDRGRPGAKQSAHPSGPRARPHRMAGASSSRKIGDGCDLLLFFVRDAETLALHLPAIARCIDGTRGLWVAWRKKASGRKSEIAFQEVQAGGLAQGLVDYKIIAIDSTWSALRFTRKRR
ncbi:MAG: hypothetical protein KBD56_00735 [Candidatus Eisenbacteria bacterium]|nr:hypothetical protein [Candidatus Eisenbacteria bacterium]